MRKLLDRLAGRLGYVTRDYPRVQMGGDAIARGSRWEQFYTETGGVRDMIEALRRSYFEKVGSLKPGDTDSLQLLGTADRIAREIDAEIRSVIESGKIAANAQDHANKIAAIRR